MDENNDKRRFSVIQSFAEAMMLCFENIASFIRRKTHSADESELWDDGEGGYADTQEDAAVSLMNWTFIIYGVLAGFVAQNYAGFAIRSFSTWAAGVSLTSPGDYSSPLTIIVSCLIVFGVYVAVMVLHLLIYVVFKLTVTSLIYDGKQLAQIAFSYGLLAIIAASLISLALPGNFFLMML